MMQKEYIEEKNCIRIVGTAKDAQFSHKAGKIDYYQMTVAVKRKSKVKKNIYDLLPVIVRKDDAEKCVGHKVEVVGAIRTTNIYTGNKLRLIVYIKPSIPTGETEQFRGIRIVDDNTEDANDVYLDGHICKKPTYRATPFNKHISDICLAVNRSIGNQSDYIPCIAWDKTALHTCVSSVGDHIEILGRMRSREYEKRENDSIEIRTAYEVSINTVKFLEGKSNEDFENQMSEL